MRDEPSIRTYYDARYASDTEHAFPPDPARYRDWLRALPRPASVRDLLDFGCGVGHVASHVTNLGYRVTGVDISRVALDIARARDSRVAFLETSADEDLPFSDHSFDVVLCLGVLEHVLVPGRLLDELHRVARPGAIGIWVVPNSLSPFFWMGRGTGQIYEQPRSLEEWSSLLSDHGWSVTVTRRDPGPVDRSIALWKRAVQAVLNTLPLRLTYQFVLETSRTS